MAAPATVDEFLDLVRKSGVADEKRLDVYVQKVRGTGELPTTPSQMAGMMVRDGQLTHFQAEQIMQGKWRRFTIGKYKVLERLGAGGMGSVYLCEHKLMRRRVAVKVLPTAKAADPSSLERFYREARAVAALDHPNIVHAYDIDQDEQLHFLVMEYVDGTNLQDLIKKAGPLDVLRACHYIYQSAVGLQHAHEKDLVHRDIKPGNILVDRQGTVKVLDMGLARFFTDEDDVLTRKYDENVLGTADYLSPEQALDSHTVDIRADIYSLGATFYFLLTGRTPFGEGTVAQKLIWHQTKIPKPVSEYRPDVPAELVAIIKKMMAREPEGRYRIPGEVADALAPFVQTPIGPPPDAEMPHLSPAATGVPAETSAETHLTRPTPTVPSPAASSAPRALQGMGSSAARPGPVVAPPRPTNPAPPPVRPATPRPAPAPQAVRPATPPPAPKPTPQQVPATRSAAVAAPEPGEAAPWESLESDTEDPSAKDDTAPNSPRSGTHSAPPSGRRAATTQDKARAKESRRLVLALVAVGVPVVLAILVLLIVFWKRSGPGGPTGRPKLTVSRDTAGKPYTYPSLQIALSLAKTGDVIELADERHAENLVVRPDKGATDVTIQSAPGVNVVWVAQRAGDPIVQISKASNFKLKGITLDGEKRVKDLVSIALFSPGVTLDGVTLQGFTGNAVSIMNAAGDADRLIRLKSLSIVGPGVGSEAVGILLDAHMGTLPSVDDYIEVAECQFQGLAAERKILVKDPSVLGGNVQLQAQ